MKFLPTLLLTLFLFIPGLRSQETPTTNHPLFVQASDDRRVWVNTGYWYLSYPGMRWYGNTNQGEFMSEAEAQVRGYRAAKNGQVEVSKPVRTSPFCHLHRQTFRHPIQVALNS